MNYQKLIKHQLIELQAQIIKEQKEHIEKLNEEIDSIKKYRAWQDNKFKEYYQFYLKDKKRYDVMLNEANASIYK